jgi:hypothetical protein
MLNNLGPFWNKIDRIAESADTHQYILRHDPDQLSRKKDNPKDNKEDRDDRTSVSIDSLIMFLQSALPSSTTPPAATPAQSSTAPPPDSRAAKAASAYASAGGQKSPPPQPQQQTNTTSPDLTEEDIRTIHILITDLENLKTKGLQTLPIQEGRNFLDSLVQAIRLAQTT